MHARRRFLGWCGSGAMLLLAVLFWLEADGAVQACGVALPPNIPVTIADESAIIVWDARTKTQHFIRRASFATKAQDFGFLVPTPTKPTLAEADNDVFKTLAKITEPVVVKQAAPSNFGCGCGGGPPKAAAPVRVLEEKRVAGYDAVILEADEAEALAAWLKEHGYDYSPALKDWMTPYVKAGWKITAFKIAKDAPEAEQVGSSAVRMTFQTEQPFFPYREPEAPAGEQQTASRRLLRVFFLGEVKVNGMLAELGKEWPGTIVWANQLGTTDQQKILQQLKLAGAFPSANWWLTEFEDWSSPRPGTADVYFTANPNLQPLARPPHIQYVSRPAPDCIMCYALVIWLLGMSLVRVRQGGGK